MHMYQLCVIFRRHGFRSVLVLIRITKMYIHFDNITVHGLPVEV